MKTKNFFRFFVLLSSFFLFSSVLRADVAPPAPPESNPHPPVTEQDKKRVDFAIEVLRLQLERDLKLPPLNPVKIERSVEQDGKAGISSGVVRPYYVSPVLQSAHFESKDLKCLEDVSCIQKDQNYLKELKWLRSTFGKAKEWRHAHIIPWSFEKFQRKGAESRMAPDHKEGFHREKPIEMHPPELKEDEYIIHIYVNFEKEGWHHLDVIVAEDPNGNITFRHFFVAPMVSDLREGVVC